MNALAQERGFKVDGVITGIIRSIMRNGSIRVQRDGTKSAVTWSPDFWDPIR